MAASAHLHSIVHEPCSHRNAINSNTSLPRTLDYSVSVRCVACAIFAAFATISSIRFPVISCSTIASCGPHRGAKCSAQQHCSAELEAEAHCGGNAAVVAEAIEPRRARPVSLRGSAKLRSAEAAVEWRAMPAARQTS